MFSEQLMFRSIKGKIAVEGALAYKSSLKFKCTFKIKFLNMPWLYKGVLCIINMGNPCMYTTNLETILLFLAFIQYILILLQNNILQFAIHLIQNIRFNLSKCKSRSNSQPHSITDKTVLVIANTTTLAQA